jgi:GNAT superfamily N-acetyltransferase
MIRYCKINDKHTEEIYGLIRSFCEESNAPKDAVEIIIDRLDNMHLFAAVEDNAAGIVGLVGYYTLPGYKAVGDFLYVKPSHRNTSIAGRLHHMAMNHGRENGVKTVAVFTKPETAKRYRKLGYKEALYVLEKPL